MQILAIESEEECHKKRLNDTDEAQTDRIFRTSQKIMCRMKKVSEYRDDEK